MKEILTFVVLLILGALRYFEYRHRVSIHTPTQGVTLSMRVNGLSGITVRASEA